MHVGMTWQKYMAERRTQVNQMFATAEENAREQNDGHSCCCCTGECTGAFDLLWQTVEFPHWLSTYATSDALYKLGVPEDEDCEPYEDEIPLQGRIELNPLM